MASSIAANAWVDPRAEIDEDVEIGPFCTIGAEAKIGQGTRLLNNVTLMGKVTLGRENIIYPNVVIGGEPQDLSYSGGDTCVEIGDGNMFREGVTINRGSEKEDGITRLGDNNFLMANVHVAHDCKLGSHIVIANGSLLAGHVHVKDYASMSGNCAIHHYVTIGSYSFLAPLSRVLHDVPPYMLAEGSTAHPRCINIVALKRNEFSTQAIDGLAAAHRLLFRTKVGLTHAREILHSSGQSTPEVERLFAFVEGQQEGKHGRGREVRRAA
ncbi:MAG: acyl-ACP--UDP-N-acetylglucosamine O-acyltransferase [Planctomycetes bacterium]|nr:acyl-ACP--UDP-N-acetylglucosamine O-acyltransferase [Planctomycetota bacterium]